MDKYEVTNEKYYVFVVLTGHIMPYYWKNNTIPIGLENHPVVLLSWEDAKTYSECLKMCMPTEAEWEYSCRAGDMTTFCFGDNWDELGKYAWFDNNSGNKTNRVGIKKKNKWGLYDMHGNVWEWCYDWFDENYYSKSPRDDPKGPDCGIYHVIRGGGWRDSSTFCRASSRYKGNSDCLTFATQCGFRVCRPAGK
jgi:formylglycine-generating enzyme required for sulfatase activity